MNTDLAVNERIDVNCILHKFEENVNKVRINKNL